MTISQRLIATDELLVSLTSVDQCVSYAYEIRRKNSLSPMTEVMMAEETMKRGSMKEILFDVI